MQKTDNRSRKNSSTPGKRKFAELIVRLCDIKVDNNNKSISDKIEGIVYQKSDKVIGKRAKNIENKWKNLGRKDCQINNEKIKKNRFKRL